MAGLAGLPNQTLSRHDVNILKAEIFLILGEYFEPTLPVYTVSMARGEYLELTPSRQYLRYLGIRIQNILRKILLRKLDEGRVFGCDK